MRRPSDDIEASGTNKSLWPGLVNRSLALSHSQSRLGPGRPGVAFTGSIVSVGNGTDQGRLVAQLD
jgi:hypothetical protein